MNFIHQSLSLTTPAPRSGEPDNFSSFFSHLKLKWSKLKLKTLFFILLFVSSFSLPPAFTVLRAKPLASAGLLLIYTGLSKTHIGSFLSLKMLPMRCVRIMTQENEVIDQTGLPENKRPCTLHWSHISLRRPCRDEDHLGRCLTFSVPAQSVPCGTAGDNCVVDICPWRVHFSYQ